MYEVEFKVELSQIEKGNLLEDLKKNNFQYINTTPQNDYYIEAKKSQYKGYDLKRYRNEADTYIYTEKMWELIDGSPARKENEHEVTKEQFDAAVLEHPHAVKVIKDREWFKGLFKDQEISVTVDSVKFDHSPSTRYFIEAEIGVEDKADVQAAKEVIEAFLKGILHKTELIDSPGMFMMAFEKR